MYGALSYKLEAGGDLEVEFTHERGGARGASLFIPSCTCILALQHIYFTKPSTNRTLKHIYGVLGCILESFGNLQVEFAHERGGSRGARLFIPEVCFALFPPFLYNSIRTIQHMQYM